MEKLIKSDQETTEEPVESEPREAVRDTNDDGSRWPLYAALILVAVGLIIGLIFLARWIYHETKSTTGTNPPSSQSAGDNGSKPTSNNPLTVNNGNNQPNGNLTPPKTAPSANNGQPLPNNGPGNVVGIFVVASFAAGALHYIISLRKLAGED